MHSIEPRLVVFMGFSRQEYCDGLLCPPPGDLPDSGIERKALLSLALAGRIFGLAPPGKPIKEDKSEIRSCVTFRKPSFKLKYSFTPSFIHSLIHRSLIVPSQVPGTVLDAGQYCLMTARR